MPEYTYDEDIFSDLYKEAFGFRPRGHEFYEVEPARKQEIWDWLLRAHDREMEEYRRQQERAVKDFEFAVLKAREAGAKDRETAIRWLVNEVPDYMQDETWNQKLSYAEYQFNLPYGYLVGYREEVY